MVHQLDHFQDELQALAEKLYRAVEADETSTDPVVKALKDDLLTAASRSPERRKDRVWQLLTATRCLFDCRSSFSP